MRLGPWAPVDEWPNLLSNKMDKVQQICVRHVNLLMTNIPNSYALAATLAAICAEIFLMLENGGYMSPFSKFS